MGGVPGPLLAEWAPQALRLTQAMVSTGSQGGVEYLPGGPSHSSRVLGEGQIWNRGILKQTQHSSVTHARGPGQAGEEGLVTHREGPEDHAPPRSGPLSPGR